MARLFWQWSSWSKARPGWARPVRRPLSYIGRRTGRADRPGSRRGIGYDARPVLRRLFTLLSAVSLVLCVATCVLWARSYRTIDSSAWTARGGNHRQVGSFAGSVFVEEWQQVAEGADMLDLLGWNGRRASAPSPFAAAGQRWSDRYSSAALWWTVLGFGVIADGYIVPVMERAERRGDSILLGGTMTQVQRNQLTLVAPHWLLAATTAILPFRSGVRAWRSWRSRRRSMRGLCPGCGYDLRATSERCPECGRGTGAASRPV